MDVVRYSWWLVFGMAACGSDEPASRPAPDQPVDSADTSTVSTPVGDDDDDDDDDVATDPNDVDGDGVPIADDCDDADPNAWQVGVYEGDVEVLTQPDFCHGYCVRDVVGDLDVANLGQPLPDLSCITSVSGAMSANSVPSLEGLGALQSVGGDLVIHYAVSSLEGLDALEWVGGDLDVGFGVNKRLDSLAGLERLSVVEGWLHLSVWEVTDLRPLSGLTHVGGLSVSWCNALTDLRGLEGITRIDGGGELRVTDNPSLESLAGLDNLVHVEGKVHLNDNLALADLSALDALEHAAGVELWSLPALTDIDGFPSLTTATGGIWIQHSDNLLDVSGFGALQSADYITIRSSDGLLDVSGFGSLETLTTGGLWIYRLPVLQTISGFGRLSHIERELRLDDNDVLASTPGLVSLETLSEIQLTTLAELTALPDLSRISSVSGEVKISRTGVTTLEGLEGLVEIGEDLDLYNNSELVDVTALHGLTWVGGDALIEENRSLASSDAQALLDAIDAVGGLARESGNGP